MNNLLFLVVALVIVLIGAFMGFNFFMCRAFGAKQDAALRETALWGVSFAVFAGIDYVLIVPGSNYSMFGS